MRAWLREAAGVPSLWWLAVPYVWVIAGGVAIHFVS
jgi:hypothetical protein